MKVVIHAFFLTLLLSCGAQSVFADGFPPSEEGVCDVLLGDGITPGLFGLCNAYCEAKDCDEYPEDGQPRSCDRILANFNNRRDESNPVEQMRCLVDDEPTCPCWSGEQFGDRGMGLEPVGCLVNVPGLGSLVEYEDFPHMVVFASTPEPGCEYDNTFIVVDPETGETLSEDIVGLTEDEDAACRADVATLVAEVSGDVPGGCVVFPPN